MNKELIAMKAINTVTKRKSILKACEKANKRMVELGSNHSYGLKIVGKITLPTEGKKVKSIVTKTVNKVSLSLEQLKERLNRKKAEYAEHQKLCILRTLFQEKRWVSTWRIKKFFNEEDVESLLLWRKFNCRSRIQEFKHSLYSIASIVKEAMLNHFAKSVLAKCANARLF